MEDRDTQFEKHLTQLMRDLVEGFTFHHQDLQIAAKRHGKFILLTWRGNKADTSRMIGKRAETFKSFVKLFKLIGEQHGYHVDVDKVGEPVTGGWEEYGRFTAKPDWGKEKIVSLLERVITLAVKHDPVEINCEDIDHMRTLVNVQISMAESLKTEQELNSSMLHIFKIIGNASGRKILVTVMRKLEPEPMQPETSAGRYA